MSYSRARAPVAAATPLGFSARDEFDSGTGGNLTGGTFALPIGGTWTGAGDADDFTKGTPPATPFCARLATGDTSALAGRYAIAGSTNYTTITVSIHARNFLPPVAAGRTIRQAALARYTDVNNWLMAYEAIVPNATNTAWVSTFNVSKRVSGTETVLASTPTSAYLDSQFVLRVDTSGRYAAWVVPWGTPLGLPLLEDSDTAVATGGTLATGKVGFYDAREGSSATGIREYDDFWAAVPVINSVLFSGRTARFKHDIALRQNAAGTSEGRVPVFEGKHLTVGPSTRANRQRRLVVKARRNDVDSGLPDLGIADTLSGTLHVTPRVDLLGLPETFPGGAFPTYYLSNVTPDRGFNANATTINELANVLGTLIDDLPVPLPTYTLSNVTTDRSYNTNASTVDELADVLGTVINDINTVGTAPAYTITNLTTDRMMNAASTNVNEVADVLGTFINDLVTAGII